MKKVTWVLLLLWHVSVLSAQEPIKVTDMLKIKSISSVSLSNDGSKAVYSVTSIEPDGDSKTDYKYISQLWLLNTDGLSQPKQLTGKEGASQPAWSPDGKTIAFVRAAEGKAQIFLLSLDGGEAIQLTKHKYGASSPRWSPDGKKILFAAGIPLKDLLKDSVLNPGKAAPEYTLERPGFDNNNWLKNTAKADPDGSLDEVRAWLDNNVTDKKATLLNKLNFQDEANINGGQGFTHYWLVDAKPGATPVPVTKGFTRLAITEWTPDGSRFVLGGNIDSSQSPERILENEIYIMNADGKSFKKLLGEKGKSFSGPRISPSGKLLAFTYGPTSFVNVTSLGIMPIDGNEKDIITIPFDRTKGGFTWSKDEKYLYFNAQSNGGAPIYRVDLKTKKVEQLTDLEGGVGSFDLANNKLVYTRTDISSPFELYLADGAAKNAKRVTSLNTEWISKKRISLPEKKTFVNEKGLTVEYWVMKPVNFEAGKKYPVVLEIHGGPSAMWGPGEASMWHEYQFFCSKGYGVVYCNPRGSGGYGQDFLRANIEDWGTGPTKDVLTSLDKTVAEGWADTSKLVVTGGSYAGYLVAWIISHDQRFKAACSQRGVYELNTFFGEGNAWRLVPNYFGGYPWEPKAREILNRESPFNYVQNIKTPYIIFHGDNDRRTGFVQSEMMFRALKVLGRPVEYVRHPGGTHELTRSGDNRQRMDQMLRTWEFFERYIR